MTDTLIAPAILDTMEEFLYMIQRGVGPKNAAVACGWTMRQLKELESMPQFQEAMGVAQDQRTESVEQKVFELAMAGNVPMIQLYLYCQASEKGWRPPAQRVSVHHQGTIAVEKVQATKAALLEIMREQGSAALAIGGPLDADIVDAEVVDGGH